MSITKAQQLYDAYNAGGDDPAFIDKNFRGDPCPVWESLPLNIQQKWVAVVAAVQPTDKPLALIEGLGSGVTAEVLPKAWVSWVGLKTTAAGYETVGTYSTAAARQLAHALEQAADAIDSRK